ncbi:MAG: 5-oxoprolinase subunit PxpB, partial [Burkholderiales bacterium]|nr:5-oxoprolinase subunit PxpB [Burkholderiales bacterium]
WVHDVVPSMAALAVHFDADAVAAADPEAAGARIAAAREELGRLIAACAAVAAGDVDADADVIEVPVCYGGEYGEDLEAVAAQVQLPAAEVVRRHCASPHRVLMVGFAPGHPYIGGLDPQLSIPRRATPRVRVPQGAVAIANGQTVVYPFAIAGGWSIIGRTPLRLFDAAASPPAIFAPGQRVRFVAIDAAAYERLHAEFRDPA